MPAPQYVCNTEGAVTLASNAAKTVVGVKAHANSGLLLLGFTLAINGTTATSTPVLVEVNYCTWATQSPGTASTSTTPRQVLGRSLTAGFTSGKTWTSEPTTQTAAYPEFLLTPNGGTIIYNFPLGTEPDCALGEGFCMRITTVTASGTPDVRAGLTVARC